MFVALPLSSRRHRCVLMVLSQAYSGCWRMARVTGYVLSPVVFLDVPSGAQLLLVKCHQQLPPQNSNGEKEMHNIEDKCLEPLTEG